MIKNVIYILLLLNIGLVANAQLSDFENIDFTKSDNIAALHSNESLENLPLLSYQLTHKLDTPVEKFRAIYKWVCLAISGDPVQHRIVYNHRKKLAKDSVQFNQWNKKHIKVVLDKLKKHKRTMCTGYAYLLKELCYFADIECEIVDGYGRTMDANTTGLDMANHSWNSVKLNGKWYLCDPTWSSGYTDENGIFVRDFNEGYFLTYPVFFNKNHYPIDQKWFLNAELSATQFIDGTLLYGEAFQQRVEPVLPSTMHVLVTKNEETQFRLKTDKPISKLDISLCYYSSQKERKINISDLKRVGECITFNTKFPILGKFDIHLKVNDDFVATYVVKVSKPEKPITAQ